MGRVLCGPKAGFTGEYLDLCNRGQWSTNWTIERERLSGVQESDGGGMGAGLLKNRMCT